MQTMGSAILSLFLISAAAEQTPPAKANYEILLSTSLVQTLDKELGLTQGQKNRIQGFLYRDQESIIKLEREVRIRERLIEGLRRTLKGKLETLRAVIRKQLSPDQAKKFDKLPKKPDKFRQKPKKRRVPD